MNNKSILFVAALSIISSAAVFAASDDASVGKTDGEMAKKGADTKATTAYKQVSLEGLQKQLNALQHQIADMKRHQAKMQKKEITLAKKQDESTQTQVQSAGLSGSAWSKLYAYGPAVVTTPIVGVPDYAGWDLYVNMGGVNEDMRFMQRRQDVYNSYVKNGIVPPERPVIALSGSIEGQMWNWHNDYSGGNQSDIDLTTVTVEAIANINQWVHGMVKLTYNDNQPGDHDPRIFSGNVYVDRAYVTVGNLDRFPIFGSIGEIEVPFEFNSSYIVGDTATKNLAKMVERPLVLGFGTHGFYGKAYAFRGETHEGGSSNVINNYGAMLGYKGQLGSLEKLTVDIGAGAIRNLADALGLQGTQNPKDGEFQGYGEGATTKRIFSTVPAVSAHAIFHYSDIIDFVSDYVGATQSFDARDMTFNGSGAKPQALDLELFYNFKVYDKPSSVGISFDRTWQALAANLPQYSYFVTVTTSLFKRTMQSIEWEHDINYSGSDRATGAGLPVTVNKFGRNSDVITGSFKIFF